MKLSNVQTKINIDSGVSNYIPEVGVAEKLHILQKFTVVLFEHCMEWTISKVWDQDP